MFLTYSMQFVAKNYVFRMDWLLKITLYDGNVFYRIDLNKPLLYILFNVILILLNIYRFYFIKYISKKFYAAQLKIFKLNQ